MIPPSKDNARQPVPTPEIQIDARYLLCPLPVLRLRKGLAGLSHGVRLHLIATDPAAVIDVPHFCEQSGNTLINIASTDDGARIFTVERTGRPDEG